MTPIYHSVGDLTLWQGDALSVLAGMPAASAQACITSPPYWFQRAYTDDPQEIGREPHFEQYIDRLVAVMASVRTILKPTGVLWLNVGDARAGSGYANHRGTGGARREDGGRQKHTPRCGYPNKTLFGIPWRIALRLQADGWLLRSSVIWHKQTPQPDPTADRPSSVYEHIFLFAKQGKYQYRPQCAPDGDVWRFPVQARYGDHRAVMPDALATALVYTATVRGDTVLDPFMGVGTTLKHALDGERSAIGIELCPDTFATAVGVLGPLARQEATP